MTTSTRAGLGLAFLTRMEFLLPAAVLAMEICWAFPWLLWLTTLPGLPWRHPPLSLPGSLLLLSAAYVAAKGLGTGKVAMAKRVGYAAAVLLLLAVVLRVEHGGDAPLTGLDWLRYARAHLAEVILAYLYGCYLLWRGSSVGREAVSFARLYRTFTFGLGALAVLLVIWAINAASGLRPGPGGLVSLMVAVFFFAGLSGLAVSNFMAMQEEAVRLGKRAQGLSGRWLSLFLLLALGVALLGLILASTLSVDIIGVLRVPLILAADLIGLILVYVIGYPLGYIAALGVFVLRWFLALINRDGVAPQIQLPQRPDFERAERDTERTTVLAAFIGIAKWVVLFALLALCIYLVVRFFLKNRLPRIEREFEETSESIFKREEFWTDFFAFWRGLLARLRKPRLAATSGASRHATPDVEDNRVLRTREIYAALLRGGERAGAPKDEAETPHEYASRLATANAEAGPDLGTITDEYVQERYGAVPTPDERIPVLNQVWRRLRALIGPPGLRVR